MCIFNKNDDTSLRFKTVTPVVDQFKPDMNMWSLCSFGFVLKSLHSHLVGGIRKKRKKKHSGVENLSAQSLERRGNFSRENRSASCASWLIFYASLGSVGM